MGKIIALEKRQHEEQNKKLETIGRITAEIAVVLLDIAPADLPKARTELLQTANRCVYQSRKGAQA